MKFQPFVKPVVRQQMRRKGKVYCAGSWNDPWHPGQRSVRGDDIRHPVLWAKLAFAQAKGLEPRISFTQRNGTKVTVDPWLTPESGRELLEAMAADDPTRVFNHSTLGKQMLSALDKSATGD